MCRPRGEGRPIGRARELAHDGKDGLGCCGRFKGELSAKQGQVLATNVLVFRASKGEASAEAMLTVQRGVLFFRPHCASHGGHAAFNRRQ